MTAKMSVGTRRRLIDYIVKTDLGMRGSVWWTEQDCNLETAAYRDWATARAPDLRAALEAVPDDTLWVEYNRCHGNPEWSDFFAEKLERQEHQQEIERQRRYHRSLSQKGGLTRRSTRQPPEISEACRDMHARNPKITAKEAYRKLNGTGHEMLDGRVIRFERPIKYESFRTRYWPKRDALH
jgi:hypothetical protein